MLNRLFSTSCARLQSRVVLNSKSYQSTGKSFSILRPIKFTGWLAALGVFTYYAYDSRAAIHELLTVPLLRAIYPDAEDAHRATIKLLKSGLHPVDRVPDDPRLAVKLFGLEFSNPVLLAAGFDKNGECIDAMHEMGFGAVEIGSVTPEPQPGNPRPRVFRLTKDEAVINRYGFNSDGALAVEERLIKRERMLKHKGQNNNKLLGINLGKNKWSKAESNQDYVDGVLRFGKYADYLVINISSPNTPGLRDLQHKESLTRLLNEVSEARDELTKTLDRRVPVLIKIAPDLTEEELADVAEVALATNIDGTIISNTTISRPPSLYSSHDLSGEKGGLSGRPLHTMAVSAVSRFHRLTNGQIPIIGCGGISSGQDALDFLLAGASLVQLYTSLLYRGPGVCRHIKDFLVQECERHQVNSVADLQRK